MAKYLLRKHHRGNPAPFVDFAPTDQSTPQEWDAHMQFMRDFGLRPMETGEFVDTQAQAPGGAFVRYGRRHGAARALPGLQRGLLRRRRPRRRGDPAHSPAGGQDQPRGGRRPAGAHAAAPRTAPPHGQSPTAGSCRLPSRTAACGTPASSPRASTCSRPLSTETAWASIGPKPPSPRCAPTLGRSRTPTGADRRVVRRAGAPHRQPGSRLNRAVAVGEADGPRAGLAALAELDPSLPRHTAAAAYLHERDGDLVTAAALYAEAARSAPNLLEVDHLTRQAGRLDARLRS